MLFMKLAQIGLVAVAESARVLRLCRITRPTFFIETAFDYATILV
jgi:hypothetical protein